MMTTKLLGFDDLNYNVVYAQMGRGKAERIVAQALANLGVPPHILSSQELATGDLSGYDTIVLGIRAYAARPELARWNRRLLDYVRNGGCLVVQYNSGEYDHALERHRSCN